MTGSGTQADPYTIYDVDDLQAMQDHLDAYYELANDIDASATIGWNAGAGFVPVDTTTGFTGHFDGKNYTISDLFINRPTTDYVGLFGYCENAEIKNVGITNCDVTGDDRVGALIGGSDDSDVTNCYSTGTVSGDDNVGSLIGESYGGDVTDCHSTCTVIGDDYAGGLIGYFYDVTVDNCNSAGTVSGGDCVGGLIGESDSGTIVNCHSTCSVSGTGWYLGGLIGYSWDSDITNCYAEGDVVALLGDTGSVGGLIGEADGGTMTKSHATGDVSGHEYVGGLVGWYSWRSSTSMTKCYATGNVSGDDFVGGLVGYTDEEAISSNITNCYAKGSVSALPDKTVGGLIGYLYPCAVENSYSTGEVTGSGDHVGGLVGHNDDTNPGTITHSFWDTQTSGQAASDGGTGKTTAEMKTKSTFTDAGWDFVIVWDITEDVNNDYPCLQCVTPDCLCITTPTVIAESANNINQAKATINGILTDDGGKVCTCHFEYAEIGGTTHTTSGESKTTGEILSANLAGLSIGTRYKFRMVAENSAGTTYGDYMYFTTESPALEEYSLIL